MHVLDRHERFVKKIRGKKRKTHQMIEEIIKNSTRFPEEQLETGYWHMHLPVQQAFIDSTKVPHHIRQMCIQTLIDRTEYLIQQKPKTIYPIRVIAAINTPDLWYSQLIVFFGEHHYNGFFERNTKSQQWIPLEHERNLQKEWRVNIPPSLTIRGYKEIVNDGDVTAEQDLWFLGEIN